jgi:hypothetical protein
LSYSWLDLCSTLYSFRYLKPDEALDSADNFEQLLKAIDREKFLKELLDCRKAAPKGSLGAMSETAVRNLLDLKGHPAAPRGRTLAFVIFYLRWLQNKSDVPAENRTKLNGLLEQLEQDKPAPKRTAEADNLLEPDALARSKLFDVMFRYIAESREERQIFFPNVFNVSSSSDLLDYANAAYYHVFRYSTLEGKILKSFLAILTPAQNKLGFFSFAHIAKGGMTSDDQYNRIKKVTRGIIMHLAPATYFIGRTSRDNSPTNTSNFEMMAIERDTLLAGRPVIHALVMSSAAVDQPIVSRAVLVRIGDKISIGKEIDDTVAAPTEFEDEKLLSIIIHDLKAMTDKGIKVDLTITDSKDLETHARVLERLIRQGINNIPRAAHARAQHNSEADPTSKSALEVWGNEQRA